MSKNRQKDKDQRASEPPQRIPDGGYHAVVLEPEPVPHLVPDAGVAIYRDKSGKPLGGTGSEGKNGIGAVTAAARSILPPDAA